MKQSLETKGGQFKSTLNKAIKIKNEAAFVYTGFPFKNSSVRSTWIDIYSI